MSDERVRHYRGFVIEPRNGDPGGSIEIGLLPPEIAKSYALFTMNGVHCTPLAYFRNEECAIEGIRLLELLAQARIKKE